MPKNKRAASSGSFSRMAELINKAGIHLKPQAEPLIPATPKAPTTKTDTPAPPSVKSQAEPSESGLFLSAMDGVHRSSWRNQIRPSSQPQPAIAESADLLNSKLMREAIDADFPAAPLDHPEYIEGWIGVAGKRFLPKLRNGLYSIQEQIDLHGLNRVEAQIAAEDFIIRMSRFHSCCIKIIHGRGINSPDGKAALKESLQRFLSTRKMSRYVVAYASAPVCDGGVGAVYVLLSRR